MKTFSIFGPPGTGKTTEVLRRIESATTRGYTPDEIGFFSFTKAAASEALKRLGITRSNTISTLHSLMFRLNGFSPMQVVDSYKLRKFGADAGIAFAQFSTLNDTNEQMEVGDQYVAIYAKARNRMVPYQEEYYDSDRPGDFAQFEYFVESYNSWKSAFGFVDYTDMLEVYLKNPRNHGARILFIDEAQDLSKLQWAVIEQMMRYEQVEEVTIAGDDDQAIYEWSGASTHGMAEFEEKWQAERTILGQSWRVPSSVHAVALSVVRTIDRRVAKLYKPREAVGEVRRYSSFDTGAIRHGDDVLILCRSFVTRQEVEAEMIAQRIPYRNEGGRPGLYDSKWADAIRAFHKLDRGESISGTELDKMIAVADNRTKEELIQRDLAPMLRRGFMRSFNIPFTLAEFFREADLSHAPTIRISTIHSAKGREAEHVVLHTGLTNKTVRDMDQNPDAESRVWYVGVTRAKNRLDIIEGEGDSYPL